MWKLMRMAHELTIAYGTRSRKKTLAAHSARLQWVYSMLVVFVYIYTLLHHHTIIGRQHPRQHALPRYIFRCLQENFPSCRRIVRHPRLLPGRRQGRRR